MYSGTIPRDFNLLVTPKVKEEVRNHFGCNELEGAELEDQVIRAFEFSNMLTRVIFGIYQQTIFSIITQYRVEMELP